jgi:hypothetical protein
MLWNFDVRFSPVSDHHQDYSHFCQETAIEGIEAVLSRAEGVNHPALHRPVERQDLAAFSVQRLLSRGSSIHCR